jgi:protein tyrosine/serine phosphatase
MESDMMPLYRIKLTDKHLQPIFVANPVTMQATLKHIKENYGSVAAYLRDAAGVEDEVIEQLRENLLQ